MLFIMVNLPFDLPRLLRSNNGRKKEANTVVNGKLPSPISLKLTMKYGLIDIKITPPSFCEYVGLKASY